MYLLGLLLGTFAKNPLFFIQNFHLFVRNVWGTMGKLKKKVVPYGTATEWVKDLLISQKKKILISKNSFFGSFSFPKDLEIKFFGIDKRQSPRRALLFIITKKVVPKIPKYP